MKRRLALAIVIAQFGLVAPALRAGGSEPATAVFLAPEPILVEGGAGNQTEPHVSGSLVSFTNQDSTTSEIRYKDVASSWPSTGIDNSTPTGGTYRDSISDVFGSVIVFKRASDTSSTESIMFFDSANPSAGPQVLANAPGAQRQAAAIGGTTVAFEQRTSSTLARNICVASITTPTAPATCLTDSLMNRNPAVSPDGNTVVWSRCTGQLSGCDIWAASKNTDGWDAPRALTSGGGNDIFPDTNGLVVTYASNLDGDSDIYFQNLDGTGLTRRIALADSGGSSEENPNISGTRISFQRRAGVGQPADLYVYHLVSDTLYQLTETPAVDEKLSDISTDSSGQSWVVWAAIDLDNWTNDDVWAASFWLPDPPPETSYEVCPLFDQSRSHRLGSTVPVRIQLCDPDGTNLSSPSLVVTATALANVDGTASTALAADSGHANPDNDFRYDDSLQGYIYNLATRGLSSGTWELQFTVWGETATYAVRFDIR